MAIEDKNVKAMRNFSGENGGTQSLPAIDVQWWLDHRASAVKTIELADRQPAGNDWWDSHREGAQRMLANADMILAECGVQIGGPGLSNETLAQPNNVSSLPDSTPGF